jgi:hypothetical protein
MSEWLKAGAILRCHNELGVVRKIVVSRRYGRLILVQWVSEVAKGTGSDSLWWDVYYPSLSPATFQELCEDIESVKKQVLQDLDNLTCLVDPDLL